MHNVYETSDDVLISDGSGLTITHIGLAHITHNIRNFDLSNILYVLSIQKNLISIP